jgi:hypothetical protein
VHRGGDRDASQQPEPAARRRAGVERAPGLGHPLGEAAQTAALAGSVRGPGAVVADLELRDFIGAAHDDLAAAGATVANHICHALAGGEAEQRLDPRGQRPGGVHAGPDARGLERVPRPVELRGEAGASEAPHRRTRLLQRAARDRLDVAHLALRCRRVATQQLARQLALQRDHGQVVAEQVVHVAR